MRTAVSNSKFEVENLMGQILHGYYTLFIDAGCLLLKDFILIGNLLIYGILPKGAL